jgi:hypothetical protein
MIPERIPPLAALCGGNRRDGARDPPLAQRSSNEIRSGAQCVRHALASFAASPARERRRYRLAMAVGHQSGEVAARTRGVGRGAKPKYCQKSSKNNALWLTPLPPV